MFRSSGFTDKRIQEIISKELLHGFDMVFGIRTGRKDIIEMMFDEFCYYMDIEFDTELEKQLMLYKIMGMYEEMKDPDHLYTFDEHGEWILFKALEKANEEIEEGFAMWDDMEEKEDRPPVLDDFWESSLTEEEKQYVRTFATEYFENEKDELFYEMGVDDKAEQDATLKGYIDDLVERFCYFPKMIREITEDAFPELLFWDTDFMFVDKMGQEGLAELNEMLKSKGIDYGFSQVDERTQMFTGSTLFEFEEE